MTPRMTEKRSRLVDDKHRVVRGRKIAQSSALVPITITSTVATRLSARADSQNVCAISGRRELTRRCQKRRHRRSVASLCYLRFCATALSHTFDLILLDGAGCPRKSYRGRSQTQRLSDAESLSFLRLGQESSYVTKSCSGVQITADSMPALRQTASIKCWVDGFIICLKFQVAK